MHLVGYNTVYEIMQRMNNNNNNKKMCNRGKNSHISEAQYCRNLKYNNICNRVCTTLWRFISALCKVGSVTGQYGQKPKWDTHVLNMYITLKVLEVLLKIADKPGGQFITLYKAGYVVCQYN